MAFFNQAPNPRKVRPKSKKTHTKKLKLMKYLKNVMFFGFFTVVEHVL